jgi:hypothetical protein
MPDFEEIVLGRPERGKKSALLVALIVFVVYFSLYRGPAEGYWDTYIAVPASLIAGEPVDFRNEDGEPAFAPSLHQSLPQDLVAPDSYGIATKDQRIGAAVLAAPFFRLFRVFGFRLLYALLPALAAMLFFSVVQGLTGRRWLGVFAGLTLVLNPFLLSYQSLNANFAALTLLVALLLVLETEPFRPVVAGLLLGALGGLRNMAVIFVPIFLVWVFLAGLERTPGKPLARRWGALKAVLLFGFGALLTILPITYWKEFAFGSPIAHPSQYPHFQGFRPTFEHAIMGLQFKFNGLLNYPFHTHWVRTPHFPYPVFLLLPMLFLSTLGIVGCGLGFVGFRPMVREHRRLTWLLLAWLFVGCLFWAFQENWEELKMSFLFLVMPPVFVFIAFGLGRFTAIGEFRTNLFTIVGFGIVAAIVLKFAFFLQFPADDRWYERFPKARDNVSQLDGLPPEKRLSPEFFLTRETDEERLELKKKLTTVCIFPCSHLPLRTDMATLGTTVKEELQTDRLTVRNVWDLIYAQQPPPSP